jgi:hypothetical protein
MRSDQDFKEDAAWLVRETGKPIEQVPRGRQARRPAASWMVTGGSNCWASAFRIKDHRAGPVTEVSMAVQRLAAHADRRRCTETRS